MPDHPNVWTYGQTEHCWSGRRLGHVDHVRPEGEFQSCRNFCSVPAGPLQSVQRAEMWGVIWALQSSGAVHLGVDILGSFVMSDDCLMVNMVLFDLNLSRMVIFSSY